MSQPLLTPHTDNELEVTDTDLRRAAQVQMVIDSLASGANITKACKVAGINRSTWARWKKDGIVQELLNEKFGDVMAGVRGVVSDALVGSTKVLAQIAQGKLPSGTAIDGTLAPRDVVTAQQQLMALWRQVGGVEDTVDRDAEALLEQLQAGHISVTTVNIQTMNVGTEQNPMPIPIGVMPQTQIIDIEAEEVLDDHSTE